MVSTPSRSRQATRISLPDMVGPNSAFFAVFEVSVCVVLLISAFAFLAGSPRIHKKTHEPFPAVGSCRNSNQARQAPTASPITTTTSRLTCRTISNIRRDSSLDPSGGQGRISQQKTKIIGHFLTLYQSEGSGQTEWTASSPGSQRPLTYE